MHTYDSTTSLIVVDVQNDFADPEGSLYVPGGEERIAFVNQQIAEAGAAGAVVVYTQDWHPPTTPHFQKDGGIWPVHCVAGTWGAEFHPALDVVGPVVQKGTGGEDGYSGFTVRDPVTGATSPTGLEAALRERDVTRVVIVGLATDYCVKATAIDAAKAGFETGVLADGIAAVGLKAGDGARAIAEMVKEHVEIV